MTSRAALAIPAFLVLAIGCGRSAEERQLDSMRGEIDNIRESRNRADGAASPRDSTDPTLVVPQGFDPPPPVRPPPQVVQLGSDERGLDENGENADPQDTTPRPSIRVFGSARGGIRNAGRRGEDQVEESAMDENTGASAPSQESEAPVPSVGRTQDRSALDPAAKRAYDAALSLANARRFDEALDSFAAFLVRWPDHPYADHAMYWRGECYFARGDYLRASEQFDGVVKRFPAGSKAPDALLKLGMSQEKLGDTVRAKESFDRLAKQYPESDAARHLGGAAPGPVAPAPGGRR